MLIQQAQKKKQERKREERIAVEESLDKSKVRSTFFDMSYEKGVMSKFQRLHKLDQFEAELALFFTESSDLDTLSSFAASLPKLKC